jgi:hypothetical protein
MMATFSPLTTLLNHPQNLFWRTFSRWQNLVLVDPFFFLDEAASNIPFQSTPFMVPGGSLLPDVVRCPDGWICRFADMK